MFQNLAYNAFIGREIMFLPSCHSTNEVALKLVKEGFATDGLLIITSNQTNGKGQRGNNWLSEPNQNLTFSIILHTDIKSHNIFNLNICVSLAINKFLNDLNISQNFSFKIKWPNDITFNSKKLGGILIENGIKADGSVWSVVGIGLNVNQIDFKYLNATSMRNIFGKEFILQNVLEIITQNIEFYLNYANTETIDIIKHLYLTNLYKYNESHYFKANDLVFEGKIIDIDSNGRLAVETANNIQFFSNQEIKFFLGV